MLRLGLPERTGWGDLGDDLARPEPGRLDVGDGVGGDAALLLIEVEDRRAVARADVAPLEVLIRGRLALVGIDQLTGGPG